MVNDWKLRWETERGKQVEVFTAPDGREWQRAGRKAPGLFLLPRTAYLKPVPLALYRTNKKKEEGDGQTVPAVQGVEGRRTVRRGRG